MYQNMDEIFASWAAQIEATAQTADKWLTFAIYCSQIGFALSLIALGILIWRWTHGND